MYVCVRAKAGRKKKKNRERARFSREEENVILCPWQEAQTPLLYLKRRQYNSKRKDRKYNQGVKSFSSEVTSFTVLVVDTVSYPFRSDCYIPKWVRPNMGKR